jgi:hypothetical protein
MLVFCIHNLDLDPCGLKDVKKQCFGSWMFIPYLYFHPSRIPDWITDPRSNNSNKRGGGIFFCPTILCSHKSRH